MCTYMFSQEHLNNHWKEGKCTLVQEIVKRRSAITLPNNESKKSNVTFTISLEEGLPYYDT